MAKEYLTNCLLGTAVGDSVGLPAEGMPARAIEKRWHGIWKQRLLFGKGMISDDTEHSFMVAVALLKSGNNPQKFAKLLRGYMRWWFICLPAGVGLGTARACVKMWLGFSPAKSGVFSAGNGPAMRSAIIGAYYADNDALLEKFVKASTLLTHSDPKAYVGALAVARLAAFYAIHGAPETEKLSTLLKGCSDTEEWHNIVHILTTSLAQQNTVKEFAEALGVSKGVSGYVYQTVPIAIYASVRHAENFRDSLEAVFNLGGDTDTVGAITGALSACLNNRIPDEWLDNISDWPLSVSLLKTTGREMQNKPKNNYKYSFSGHNLKVIFRNIFFLFIVLLHGFYRLLPKIK